MKTRTLCYALIGTIILTVAAYAGTIIYLTWPISEISIEKSGVFGDSFGLLTSLFSGLAFAGLIITISMQRDELSLQRQELTLTRTELSGQKDELRAQNDTLKVQRFESTFFQMLGILESCRNDISHKSFTNVATTGRDAIRRMYEELARYGFHLIEHSNFDVKYIFDPKCTSQETINKYYTKFYEKNGEDLGQYFRTLYNILKLIERSAPIDDKSTYSNLLRAQLSRYELLLLAYNCISDLGEKMAPLVNKYKILKHIETDLVIEQHRETPGFFNLLRPTS